MNAKKSVAAGLPAKAAWRVPRRIGCRAGVPLGSEASAKEAAPAEQFIGWAGAGLLPRLGPFVAVKWKRARGPSSSVV